jgi:hypothetical protein
MSKGRISIAVSVLLLATACTGTSRGAAQSSAAAAIPDPPRPAASCSEKAEYCNVAEQAGIADVPRYGRGVSFADVDGDGDDDVFIADTDERLHFPYGVSALYLNRGDGSFERRDVGLEDADLFATWGGAFGDYDNDGAPDLLITNGGFTAGSNVALYHNDMRTKGKFTRATDTSGIGSVLKEDSYWGGSWADYDLDGWADFVVVPLNGPVRIFHNRRDGTFSDETEALGLTAPHFVANNPVWFDMDQDHDPDLFIPDDDLAVDRDYLYENRVREGMGFVEVSDERIGNIWPDRQGGVFAAAAADFNQDGFDDPYLGRWTWQDLVLVNDGRGYFKAYGREVGIDKQIKFKSPLEIPGSYEGDPAESENTMGLGISNFDGELPKVFIGTGNPKFAYNDIVYCTKLDQSNPAGFRFERCSEDFVAGQGPTRAHGVAFSDIDDDGDTGVVWAHGGHPERHAEGEPFVDTRQWSSLFKSRKRARTATIDLVGLESGRDAFGARVRTTAGSITRYDTVRCQQGFVSQNSHSILVPTDELGTADVTISWPMGGSTRVSVRAGTRSTIYEDGRVETRAREA